MSGQSEHIKLHIYENHERAVWSRLRAHCSRSSMPITYSEKISDAAAPGKRVTTGIGAIREVWMAPMRWRTSGETVSTTSFSSIAVRRPASPTSKCSESSWSRAWSARECRALVFAAGDYSCETASRQENRAAATTRPVAVTSTSTTRARLQRRAASAGTPPTGPGHVGLATRGHMRPVRPP